MSDRGDYRAIHTVIVDSPEFMDLSPEAQLVFFHLKLRLGATGIDVVPAAEGVLAESSNLSLEQVRTALSELCGESPTPSPSDGIPHPLPMGWLRRERHVFWLRNALRFEPSRTLSNENHRKNILGHLAGLPKLAIVNDFADYYELPRPFPEVGDTPSPSKGIPDHGDGRTEERKNGRTDTDTETACVAPALESGGDVDEDDRLAQWLNGYSASVADCHLVDSPQVRSTLFQLFGPPGMRARAWELPNGSSVPEAERPRIFAAALLGYAAEGKQRIVTNEFAGVVRKIAEAEIHAASGGDLSHWED